MINALLQGQFFEVFVGSEVKMWKKKMVAAAGIEPLLFSLYCTR